MKLKRNKHLKEFKLRVIKEAMKTGNKVAVARRYKLATDMLHRWIKEYEAGKFGVDSLDVVNALKSKQLAKENDQLKRLLGEQAFEIAILLDLIKKKNPHLLKK